MAGDCPHGMHLQASLQHHHHDSGGGGEEAVGGVSGILINTHEKYLQIIDELKNDLEQMSCEVVQVHNECCSHGKGGQHDASDDDEVDLTASLKELEDQNDRLQEALKLRLKEKDTAYREMEATNNNLKCQIHQLEQNLTASEQHILHLTTLLNRSAPTPAVEFSCRANAPQHPSAAPIAYTNQSCNCQHQIAELEKRLEKISKDLDDSRRQEHFLRSETRKLNEELNESKRKNANLYAQSQRLAGLLKSQESHRMELAQKFDSLEKNFEDQSKKLRAAHTQLKVLNERYKLMERTEMEHKMEGDLLRKEVLSLKEKEAIVVGRQKSLQEQMIKTEKELYNAHEVIQKQQAILRSNDVRHAGELRQLREEKLDAQRNIKILEEDYQRLREAYENEQAVSKQSEELLSSYRQWREDQLKAETIIREKFKEFEELFGFFYKDKSEYMNAYRLLREDYRILEAEFERLRLASFSPISSQLGLGAGNRSITDRLALLRDARSRIFEQSSLLRDDPNLAQTQPTDTTGTQATNTNEDQTKN